MGGPFLLAALAVLLVVLVARADSDVVVENTDTTDIVYSPQASWIETTSDPLFASGTSMRTNDPDANATLTFTGAPGYACGSLADDGCLLQGPRYSSGHPCGRLA